MDVKGVHLNHEVVNANKVEMKSIECTKEAIQLNFGLLVPGLVLVPGDGPKSRGVAPSVCAVLGEDPPNFPSG